MCDFDALYCHMDGTKYNIHTKKKRQEDHLITVDCWWDAEHLDFLNIWSADQHVSLNLVSFHSEETIRGIKEEDRI